MSDDEHEHSEEDSGASWADQVRNMPESLNVSEAALILRMHTTSVRRLASRGEIPGVKLGGEWRFSKRKLLALLQVELDDGEEPDSPG